MPSSLSLIPECSKITSSLRFDRDFLNSKRRNESLVYVTEVFDRRNHPFPKSSHLPCDISCGNTSLAGTHDIEYFVSSLDESFMEGYRDASDGRLSKKHAPPAPCRTREVMSLPVVQKAIFRYYEYDFHPWVENVGWRRFETLIEELGDR